MLKELQVLYLLFYILGILAFCIYIASAAVGARYYIKIDCRLPYESSEECDYLDGVLAATILQMMNRLNQVL